MNNRYNFDWVVEDIFNSMVFKLYYRKDNNEIYCGTYEVHSLLSFTGDELDIGFANVDGLNNLINMGIVRFIDIDNSDNIVDIPLRKIYMLYSESNELGSDDKRIEFNSLDGFSMYDGEVISSDYVVSTYLIDEISDDLKEVMDIAKDFGNMGMQEQFDAISRVNLINYNRSKGKGL